jgi:lysine 2,3-aminomutase
MELWQEFLASAIRTPAQLSRRFPGIDVEAMERVAEVYPMCVTPYYLDLIRQLSDPIAKQCIPDPAELDSFGLVSDPLAEESMSPVPCVVHRYPDRALFLVSTQCAMYCRFCTRKRKVRTDWSVSEEMRREGLAYIERTPEIRDVVVSGGDPLMLSDGLIDSILSGLRRIPHVEVIRVGTRAPCTLPQRITPRLVNTLRKYHPLYVNTHFEHPRELTPEAVRALARLADAGIPLGNQSVLLRGVNDDPAVFLELNRRLLAARVKPYYMFQADLVDGTAHFCTPIETGLNVIRGLRGHTSGMAVPHFVIDSPGGGGKIPILPEEYVRREGRQVILRNFRGHLHLYNDRAAEMGSVYEEFAGVPALVEEFEPLAAIG